MNHSSPIPIDDAARDRCLRYLLGELGEPESATFEFQLAKSPELANELLELSETVCLVSDLHLVPVEPAGSTNVSWKFTVAAVALAASLMIALVSWPNSTHEVANTARDSSTPEDLLIAQAWVGERLSDEDDDSASLLEELELMPAYDEQAESDDDASLSWMVAAVAKGEPSDG